MRFIALSSFSFIVRFLALASQIVRFLVPSLSLFLWVGLLALIPLIVRFLPISISHLLLRVPLNPHLLDSAPSDPIFLFWARLWDFISQIVHLQALSLFLVSALLSSHLLNSAPQVLYCRPFKASLDKSFHQVSCIFYLNRSPITMRPLWKIFIFFTWASRSLQRDHFENLEFFHLGKLSITMKPFWKIFEFFT